MNSKNWRTKWPLFLLVATVLALLLPGAIAARSNDNDLSQVEKKIEPLVLEQLNTESQTDYFIWLTEKADLSPAYALQTKAEKGQFVFDTLVETAERTQADLRAYLDGQGVEYRPYYIANKIYVAGTDSNTLYTLAAREDVARITANHKYQLQEPFIDESIPASAPTAVESNLIFINVDDVWTLGYDGSGRVVAGNDTGLDWDHPALINQYRGWDGSTANHNYNWWDATGTYPTVPDDGHGHGTHTTGTMVGDDGAGAQIGVAPGAQMVHCKNMTNSGGGDDNTFTECFEWDLAPWDLTGNNPMPSLAPDVVNNSWGYWGGNDPVFNDEVDALRAAGIVVEVSAGNEGPSCGTLRSPGDYAPSLTTGSVSHFTAFPGTITGFSSRGPSALSPGEYVPDIMAPGENINSSVPGGGYSGPTWSGTSMAGPHVAALVALMWEASPGIAGDVALTEQIIIDTAVPLTGATGSNCGGDYTTGPNHDWGYGTIDAYAAVQQAILLGGPFSVEASPATLAVCAPDNALYNIDVALNEPGYTGTVVLSTSGEPTGATIAFAPASGQPAFSSVLTLGTAAVNPGSYTFDIVGTEGAESSSDSVSLDVFTTLPSVVSLVAPADGAISVAITPAYEWTAVTQAGTYLLEVATDSGFSNIVYSATVTGNTHTQTTALTPVTTYYWRITASNACGAGSTSATFEFTTADIPPILLVDDDDNSPDVQATYVNALNNIGAQYDIWDTNNSDNEPSAADLAPYSAVIWFTNDEFGGAAGPGAAGEAALSTWLDNGGCLFMNSQDYLYDRGLTPFGSNYLGIGSFTSDVAQTSATGTGSVFSGFGPYSLVYPGSNFSDLINPSSDPTVELAFTGNQGNAAVNKDTGVYRTTYWGFSWEAISTPADREAVLQHILNWCGSLGDVGQITGTVTDADSGDGIAGATITAVGTSTFSTLTNGAGEYNITLPVDTYDVTASLPGYYVPDTATGIVVTTTTPAVQDFVLQGSSLTYTPDSIEETMQLGDVVTNTVTVTNDGPLPIDWSVSIGSFNDPVILENPIFDEPTIVVPANQQNATTTTGLNLPTPANTGNILAAGDIIDSWSISGIVGWGIALDGSDLWISSPGANWGGNATINNFALDGTPGVSYPYTWNPLNGPGDATYNWNTGMLWVLDIGQGNCIHEVDPSAGVTGNTICPAFPVSQRGLAYDPTTDTYFAAGWNDLTIFHFDSTGAILQQVNVGLGVSGLAYNPETQHLFVMVNASPNPVYVLDAANGFSQIGQFNVAGFGDYSGAGLEIDCDGNLWAVNQLTNEAVLFESGESASLCAAKWATATPDSGTIPAGSTATFDVVFDSTALTFLGQYTAELSFSGTFVNDVATMPLTMNLTCPTCGTLDGSITDDLTGDPLVADINITDGTFDVTVSGSSYNIGVPAGTYDITVSAAGYFSETTSVTVATDETVTTDFDLVPQYGELHYSPAFIEENMLVGDIVTNTVTVTNNGTYPFDFSVQISGFTGPDSAIRVIPLTTDSSLDTTVSTFKPQANNVFAAAGVGSNVNSLFVSPNADVDLILDDGSRDDALGLTAGGQFVWFNRFTPSPADYPFTLNEVQILFGAGVGVNVGELVDIYIYEDIDGDGDPATGATILGSQLNATVQAVDDSTWSTYILDTPVVFENPGDVLIAVVNRTAGIGAGTYVAAMDMTSSQGRSWIGLYSGNPANPPTFPADSLWGTVDSVGFPGNWMVRGFANYGAAGAWATATPNSGTVPPGSSVTFEVVFDSTGLTEGTYTANLNFNGDFINTPPTMPLTMNLICPTCAALNGSITDSFTGDPVVADIHITDGGSFSQTVSGSYYNVIVDAGTYDITVSAPGYYSATETVTISSGTITTDFALDPINYYGVEISADQTGTGAPGNVVMYTFTLTNLGNNTDTFDVALSGNAWATTLSDTSVTLAPGASTDIMVHVTVDAAATDGDTDVVTITATSTTDSSASDSATATTTADENAPPTGYTLYLPIIIRP